MEIGNIDIAEVTWYEWCIFAILFPFMIALLIYFFINIIGDGECRKEIWRNIRWQIVGKRHEKKRMWYHKMSLHESKEIISRK